jgi:succinate dehydrogenase / fumarate reductase cytochrome b subunit
MEVSKQNINSIFMEKPNQRIVDLPLLKIKLPVGGMVSIIHRITGVFLVLLIPGLTYLLQQSLASAETFDATRQLMQGVWIKAMLFLAFVFLIQHLASGIRHLLLDAHVWMGRRAARISAWSVILASLSLSMVAAWRIFL